MGDEILHCHPMVLVEPLPLWAVCSLPTSHPSSLLSSSSKALPPPASSSLLASASRPSSPGQWPRFPLLGPGLTCSTHPMDFPITSAPTLLPLEVHTPEKCPQLRSPNSEVYFQIWGCFSGFMFYFMFSHTKGDTFSQHPRWLQPCQPFSLG